MTASARRIRAVSSAASVCALGTILALAAPPAQARWQNLDARAVNVVHACRDGLRFEAGLTVFDGQQPQRGPYRGPFKIAQPAPPDGSPWDEATVVARATIVVPELARPITLPRADDPADTITLSHKGTYLVPIPAARRPLALQPVGLVLGASEASYVTEAVQDCYLFAPVDIVPNNSRNRVMIGRGQLSVALMSTPYLRADRLNPAAFRFGPASARARASRVVDVNRDGRRDLVLTFRTAATGLTCKSTSGTLVGTTRAGGRVEGRDRIVPVCR